MSTDPGTFFNANVALPSHLQDLTLGLWDLSERGTSGFTPRMAALLRAAALTGDEHQAVLRAFRRMVHLRRRVAHALGEALETLTPAARDRARWLATELLSEALPLDQARRQLHDIDWERALARDAAALADPDPVRRLAVSCSLPDPLAAALRRDWQDEAHALARALARDPPLTVRANRLRTTRAQLAAELAALGVPSQPTRFAAEGLTLDTARNVFELPPFQRGAFEVQDEGSQLIAELVAPPPGSTVVDACAGAGGKTLALAAALGGKGHVLALDIDEPRLAALRERARRAGASNVRALAVAPEAWPDEALPIARRAARILVDAPCSGLGTLRRHPELRWRFAWHDDELAAVIAAQQRLVERAAALLAPGARLIYATCSLLRAENEGVLAHLLAHDKSLELVSVKEILGKAAAAPISDPHGEHLRLSPHRHGTDGFFAAVVRRRRG